MINMIIVVMSLFSNASQVTLPKTVHELRNVAVKITDKSTRSGGTGSILSSGQYSVVLTNAHVCGVVVKGGYVIKDRLLLPVIAYKTYQKHDLCLVKVKGNLNTNLQLASSPPKMSEESNVSGFPRLFPNTVTKGHFSDLITVPVMVGVRECKPEEMLTDMECAFFGEKPVVKMYIAQHTSNLIQPGNSGSGVFNKKGQLSGVVFAGSGELGFALIVPYHYVVDFIKNQKETDWQIPMSTKGQQSTDEMDELESILIKCNNLIKNSKIKLFCKSIKRDLLER